MSQAATMICPPHDPIQAPPLPEDLSTVHPLCVHGLDHVPESRRATFMRLIWDSLANYPKEAPAAPPLAPGVPQPLQGITGTFFSPALAVRQGAEWLDRELDAMAALGFDTLLLNLAAPPGSGGDPQAALATVTAPLDTVLPALAARGFRFLLGLASPEVAWMMQDADALRDLSRRINQVTTPLAEQYGSHPGFAGWYAPYELCDVFIERAATRRLLPEFVRRITDHCHRLTPAAPVVIAPYFRTAQPPDQFAAFWHAVLDATGADILAMQDSVGIHHADRLAELPAYSAALAAVCRDLGKRFWSDLELFAQDHGAPRDTLAWSAAPAPAETVIQQVTAEAPWVEKIIVWEFTHFMSPQMGARQAALYTGYRSWATAQGLLAARSEV